MAGAVNRWPSLGYSGPKGQLGLVSDGIAEDTLERPVCEVIGCYRFYRALKLAIDHRFDEIVHSPELLKFLSASLAHSRRTTLSDSTIAHALRDDTTIPVP